LKRYVIIALIHIIAALALTGCVNLLEGEKESISEHVTEPYVRPSIEQIAVSGYDEFFLTLLGLILDHETENQLIYHPLDGEDVQAEIQRACYVILNEHPIGAYAVADITVNAIRLVTYFEVDIVIEYKRTHEQLDSIITISTERYMRTQLLNIMSEHREEAIIRSNLRLSDEEITEFVRETYYQNPRRVVMLPFVTVETFPEEGVDRIYEVKFSYTESPSMLQQYSDQLLLYVRRNAANAVGETDAEILLFLVENLIASATFDEGTARTIHTHGAPNLAATAFGALVGGSAVGEGFAMAFKALCDELGFDNRVVLGYFDGRIHAWNIVSLEDNFYHIDVAMSAVNGLETAFLKTDTDFMEMYQWDRENTVRCEGTLTLEDIIGPEEPEEPDDPDNPRNPDDPENPESPDSPDNPESQNDALIEDEPVEVE